MFLDAFALVDKKERKGLFRSTLVMHDEGWGRASTKSWLSSGMFREQLSLYKHKPSCVVHQDHEEEPVSEKYIQTKKKNRRIINWNMGSVL